MTISSRRHEDNRRRRVPPKLRGFVARAALSIATIAAPSVTLAAPFDIVEITVSDIQAGLAAGTFTAVELLQAHLDRINIYEPHYNAFTFFSPTALAEAAALDAEYAISGPRSPLHGVPIVIKEAMDVKGLPSTGGYAGFSALAGGIDLIPETDAPVVQKLRDAGAIIIGKTNIPEFSRAYNANNSWDGPTYNAYDRTLSPGGSSAGTGLAGGRWTGGAASSTPASSASTGSESLLASQADQPTTPASATKRMPRRVA